MGATMKSFSFLRTSLVMSLLPCCLGGMQSQESAEKLDDRIDPARITSIIPIPKPDSIALPVPASHRIAMNAEAVPLEDSSYQAARSSIARALDYLSSVQSADGSWMNKAETAPTDDPKSPAPVVVAVTALGVKGFSQSGEKSEQLDRGIDFLLESTGTPQGFALGDNGKMGTYVASSVGSALASIDDPQVTDRLQSAIEWLKEAQWDEGEGLARTQDWYGGVGYGNQGRPDLSNTQMMLDALHDAGVSPEDPAVQRALQFVSRTQNLTSTNGADWAANGTNDGGFIYTAANGGESMGSEYSGEGRHGEHLPEGQDRSLRSYGSMTYAGFKSLLYAGLTSDDPRVTAAYDWIRRNWTFAENPGLGQQGWFYYLHAMSRALNAAQLRTITTPDGTVHDWREELIDTLVSEQRPDGSWANEEPRWLEDEPVLATTYAILALQEAIKPGSKSD
jgi:squalene-hopene/tetraprenyl-beta-curcumene cyclase